MTDDLNKRQDEFCENGANEYCKQKHGSTDAYWGYHRGFLEFEESPRFLDMLARERKLVEALEFYANKDNWSLVKAYDRDVSGVIDEDDVECSDDTGGKLARKTLAEIRGK